MTVSTPRPDGIAGVRWKIPFVVLNISCLALFAYSWKLVSDAGHDLVYIYFQPLVPVLLMLWLWGVNVGYFETSGIKYDALFGNEERRFLLRGDQIFELAAAATTLTSGSAAAFVMALTVQNTKLASLIPVGLYGCLVLSALCPFNALHKSTRLHFSSTFRRVVLPVQSVTFSDFILADILTSLAKAFADIHRASCLMTTGDTLAGYINGTVRDPEKICSRASWHVNLVLALPYLFRLCQCVIVSQVTGDRNQLRNALKYSTAIPVIGLSMVKYHVSMESWTGFWWKLWILASVVNTLYSYYWDIEMDWDVPWFSQCGKATGGFLKSPTLKTDAMYTASFYKWAIGSNFFMRIAWIYKLSSHLRYNKNVNFLVAVIEVCRRFQWVFIRVECGLNKLQDSQKGHTIRGEKVYHVIEQHGSNI
ncbi:hypothetical protein BSKO_11602 [Bryopsis sp. KO-2023]|nr:hypothetical protein BSKO_11602 [Bryopsis sp. KO-2023]